MLDRTDHPGAPWQVIAGDDKRYARVAVIRAVCEAIETSGVRIPPGPLGR
jgi:polyphosphate kinase 2 (PPK2 family)